MAFILERTIGLPSLSEDEQVAGYDARYWDIVHDLEPSLVPTGNGEQAAVGTQTDGEPPPADLETTSPGR